MLSERENLQIALDGGKPHHVPCLFAGGQIMISSAIGNMPPFSQTEGFDWWGVHWTACAEAGWNFSPTAGRAPVISDITKWREQLKIPDISGIDWASAAARDTANFDPEKLTIFFGLANGIFERVHFLLGFEETMIALMLEPEEVAALANAIADFYVQVIEKVGQYYKPDYLDFLDDYTHKDGSFMSPDTFDAVFAPALKKIVDAVEGNGMKYIHHCCGQEQLLLDNFYRIGIRRTEPWQPCNDTCAMQAKFPDMVFIGGGDSQFVIDYPGTTEEQLRAEIRRCIDSYGEAGNYVMYPFSIDLHNPAAYQPGGKMLTMIEEAVGYSYSKV